MSEYTTLGVLIIMGIATFKLAMFHDRATATRRRCRRYEEDEVIAIMRTACSDETVEEMRKIYGHDWRRPGE